MFYFSRSFLFPSKTRCYNSVKIDQFLLSIPILLPCLLSLFLSFPLCIRLTVLLLIPHFSPLFSTNPPPPPPPPVNLYLSQATSIISSPSQALTLYHFPAILFCNDHFKCLMTLSSKMQNPALIPRCFQNNASTQ